MSVLVEAPLQLEPRQQAREGQRASDFTSDVQRHDAKLRVTEKHRYYNLRTRY